MCMNLVACFSHLFPFSACRLQVIANDGSSKLKHVKRARIIRLADQGLGTMATMAGFGVSKPMAWHWLQWFMEEGMDSLLRDHRPFAPDLEAAKVFALQDQGHESSSRATPVNKLPFLTLYLSGHLMAR